MKHDFVSPNADRILVLVPALNEEKTLPSLLAEARLAMPEADFLVLDDGSMDHTAEAALATGARLLRLPCNLGVGGAMQAGFRYAYREGYRFAIRIDGDGQHPPSECPRLIERMLQGDVDMVVGSRFLGDKSYTSTWYRQVGIAGLAALLTLACRRRITDPTSGFQIVNRQVMYYFAHHYPTDYPEPESLALLSRQGYRCCETPTRFRARAHGESSIKKWGTIYYMFKVSVALFVDRCRAVDSRFDRHRIGVGP